MDDLTFWRRLTERRIGRRRLLKGTALGGLAAATASLIACGGEDATTAPTQAPTASPTGTTAPTGTPTVITTPTATATGVATGSPAPTGTTAPVTGKRGGVFSKVQQDQGVLDVYQDGYYGTFATTAIHAGLLQFVPVEGYTEENFEIAATVNIEPMVAQSLEQPDELTYVMPLRTDVKFHNGAMMTGEDVLFSIDKAKAGIRAGLWDAMTSREVSPDGMLTIKTGEADVTFLLTLADAGSAVTPTGSDSAENPIGAGPFVYEKYEPGVSTTTTRFNEFFMGGDRPFFDRYEVLIVPDKQATVVPFIAGQATSLFFPTPEMVQQIRSSVPDAQVLPSPDLSRMAFLMNNQIEPLNDVRVRQAMTLAVIQQGYIDLVYGGDGSLAGVLPGPHPFAVPPDQLPWIQKTIDGDANIDEAKQLLAAAGVPDGFTIQSWANPHPTSGGDQQLLQQQLKAIGVNLELLPAGDETAIGDRLEKKDYQTGMLWLISSIEADPYLRSYHPDLSPYWTGWGEPSLHEKIIRQRTIVNPEERRALINEIQMEIAEGAYLIYLPTVLNFEILQGNVTNWRPTAEYFASTRWGQINASFTDV